MQETRPAAVAGMFYPAQAEELRNQLTGMLDSAAAAQPPKAMIAPHAGYIYSGAVAATAYKSLAAVRDRITRVVLLGPTHRVYVNAIAASSAKQFQTPLGDVPVEWDTVRQLVNRFEFVQYHDAAHAEEHSLEVHLPFLQQSLNNFSLIPMAVGDVNPQQVEQLLDDLWGGEETLVVVSSDLSHYHDYATAKRMDAGTTASIMALQPQKLSGERACGHLPVRGLLRQAKKRGLKVMTADLRNSGDTAGGHDRVVGYGSYLLYPGTMRFNVQQRHELNRIAVQSISQGIDTGAPLEVPTEGYLPLMTDHGASFVTLKNKADDSLRGCIGSLSATRPLVMDVAVNAFNAACRDPRFQPVSHGELSRLSMSISVLTPPQPMVFASEQELIDQIRPGIDGLILEDGARRGTFLPAVWEQIPQRRQFLIHLKRKAGLPEDHWSATVTVQSYTTETF